MSFYESLVARFRLASKLSHYEVILKPGSGASVAGGYYLAVLDWGDT
jgi:hypothetical protein